MWEVESRSGRSRSESYAASPESTYARHRCCAAASPASGSSSPGGSSTSGMPAVSSSVSQCAPVGASTGARQPCSDHAFENGV